MTISAKTVMELREKTGVGMMECKAALQETQGDMQKAIDHLRQRGLAKAAKRSGRSTAEGVVAAYLHMGGKIGVLVEVNCETDFVAKTDEFQALAKDIAMHVAAANPLYVRREDVPEAVIAKEREIYRAQLGESKKPPEIMEKILDGKMNKFFEETCLVEQAFVKDPDHKVNQLVTQAVSKTGENIQIRRFTRYRIGEE